MEKYGVETDAEKYAGNCSVTTTCPRCGEELEDIGIPKCPKCGVAPFQEEGTDD